MELQFRKAQVIENRYLLEGEKGQLATLPGRVAHKTNEKVSISRTVNVLTQKYNKITHQTCLFDTNLEKIISLTRNSLCKCAL